MKRERAFERSRLERSAGGVVLRPAALSPSDPEILMIRVRNLQGKTVWTFPKGHLERGETFQQAAAREVLEETGWECSFWGRSSRPFKRVQYFFRHKGQLIRKQVIWFLMRPVQKTGQRDPVEVLQTRWMPLSRAREKVTYESDKKLLKKLEGKEVLS